ncbi:CPBP family intramembrane metalloprotease, partial [Clostridium perfringens]|nr:CPBP family intramembrane metalloprotease [Clostridium perfringens]
MKKIIIRVNPFKKDEGDISKGLYVIKKLLGFFLVYISSMIIGEVIVVFGLNLAGYDFLQVEMPKDDIMMLIKYYGFSIHLIITILYCKFIEYRDVE